MAMIPPKKALQGNTSHLMPSELMDKCVGQRMWILMKGEREYVGMLVGFDTYVNMVLQVFLSNWTTTDLHWAYFEAADAAALDVTEIERTPEGIITNKVEKMLLNGNNVAMLIPGAKPDDVDV